MAEIVQVKSEFGLRDMCVHVCGGCQRGERGHNAVRDAIIILWKNSTMGGSSLNRNVYTGYGVATDNGEV